MKSTPHNSEFQMEVTISKTVGTKLYAMILKKTSIRRIFLGFS